MTKKKTLLKRLRYKRIFLLLGIVCCFIFLGVKVKQMFVPEKEYGMIYTIVDAKQIHTERQEYKAEKLQEALSKPETKDTSYFNDAVFIGDSRVDGFILNAELYDTTAYTHIGLAINKVFTEPLINMNGTMVTIMDAMRQTDFNKVYLMFGINEMGWNYSDVFINNYEQIIDEIRNINPNAKIYVQSILPVSAEVSNTHEYINNNKVVEFNQLLRDMAQKKSVTYVNVYECIVDQLGNLPDDAASDGIHLKKEYCLKWCDYLLTHIN